MNRTLSGHQRGPRRAAPTSRSWRAAFALLAFLATCVGSIACSSGDREPDLESIRLRQIEGRHEETIEPLRELLRDHPDDPELNFLYGRALVQTGRPDSAQWSLRKAMANDDWLVPAGLQMAFQALASRNFNEVISITDRILEVEPDNVNALLMRASAHAHWKKDPQLALEAADRVLEISPDTVAAYEPRILALLDLDRFEEARASLATAGERIREVGTTDEVLAWHCSTTAAFEEYAEEIEQARSTWLRCIEAYPADPEVVGNAVVFFDEQNEPERSLEILEAAFAADPSSRNLRVSLANRLVFHGRTADAEALLREATRNDDPNLAWTAWLDLANLQQSLGDSAAAADSLGRSVAIAREIGPPDPSLLFQHAESLLVAGDMEGALQAGDALKVPAQRHLIRARVAQKRGDAALALKEFDEALRLWPDNTYARYYAALAAESVGDFDRAIEEYRYSIRIEPTATDARLRCARLLVALRRWAEANQVLHSSYASAPLDLWGELLAIKIAGGIGANDAVADKLELVRKRWPGWSGKALAEAAAGVAERSGPSMALSMLAQAPGVDYAQSVNVPALRALVEYGHASGRVDQLRSTLDAIYAAHPEDGAFQTVRALDLELSGADADAVLAAWTRASELAPNLAQALAGLGQATRRDGDPKLAIEYLDRAATLDPSDPGPAIEAAHILFEQGALAQAAARLDRLLASHPLEGKAAALRVKVDLGLQAVTEQTRAMAQRAVRLGRAADDWDLLAEVDTALGDAELAQEAARKAQFLRDQAAPAG